MNKKIIVLSLGGSLIIPKTGFNTGFLRNFKKLIVELMKNGYRFILVCGGGNTARLYQSALKGTGEMNKDAIDWVGIYATRLNACLIKMLLQKWVHPKVVENPTKKFKWRTKILIGAGWKPGCSTDKDAVLLAKVYGAKEVINISNIDYVYTADPRKNPKAKPLPRLTWPELRKIIGNKWNPGANVPFDPSAAREAQRLGLKVLFVKGTNLKELEKAIAGRPTRGTVIE